MQNLISTDSKNFRVRIKGIKLTFLVLQWQTKKNLNHYQAHTSKNRNIDRAYNASLQTWSMTGIHFRDTQLAPTKNQIGGGIGMCLSAKLTKVFRVYFRVLLNFLSQEIFCRPEIDLNLSDFDNKIMHIKLFA